MLGITHVGVSGQRGFTLIEMSIVLVIIGLIIGGILKGQEIIESSRQKNVITQIDTVRAAINTFADKYNALPGDYGSATARVNANLSDGNDNGLIGANDLVATGGAASSENIEFFNHLNGAELVSGTTITQAIAAGFGDGQPLPTVAIPGAGMTVVYGLHNEDTNAARQTHWVRIHKGVAGVTSGATNGAFTGRSLFQVDLKIDDGNGVRGSARNIVAHTDCSTAAGAYVSLGNIQSCVGVFELVQ
ncbi:MAG: prepilin-type N-terminal cleavage/methylation domain-containing protein [Alphaproteobacteria bacterium]|nr:prepilin-type N-terminal cleavage/methylation domain-containing protein [Alphaproteobacteria bacterium]